MSALAPVRRLLVVATKPPWPPVGGGSVQLHALLVALAARGVEAWVVAPGAPADGEGPCEYHLVTVPTAPRRHGAALAAVLPGRPLALERWRLEPLARAVDDALARLRPQVVHLEQLQLAWLIPRLAGRAVLLREQNVEWEVLARLAGRTRPPLGWMLAVEARRVRRAERRGCEAASVVAAITERDRRELARLAPRARVEVLPPAAPALTPPRGVLAGDPPVVCLGSFDWRPNRDGVERFLREGWPQLRRALPEAVLHLAGPGSDRLASSDGRVRRHGRVPSVAAFLDPRAVLVVPVWAGSGLRMRLLEAWAVGLPAVTTPVGGEELVGSDGDGALLAAEPAGLAHAVARLAASDSLRRAVVARGRTRLAAFVPDAVAGRALELYRAAAEPTA